MKETWEVYTRNKNKYSTHMHESLYWRLVFPCGCIF